MIKLIPRIYLVGSGEIGISHRLDCHIYFLDGGSEAALIDAGVGLDNKRIIENIKKTGINETRVKHLFLTHSHADHSGGARHLKKYYSLHTYLGEFEKDIYEEVDLERLGLNTAKKEGYYPEEYILEACKIDHVIKDGSEIAVGDLKVKAIITPGHSIGSLCYLVQVHKKNILFSGDTVFNDGLISLINCYGSSLSSYREGIKKLKNLAIDALLPGHKLFVLERGQEQIDKAIKALQKMSLPRTIF